MCPCPCIYKRDISLKGNNTAGSIVLNGWTLTRFDRKEHGWKSLLFFADRKWNFDSVTIYYFVWVGLEYSNIFYIWLLAVIKLTRSLELKVGSVSTNLNLRHQSLRIDKSFYLAEDFYWRPGGNLKIDKIGPACLCPAYFIFCSCRILVCNFLCSFSLLYISWSSAFMASLAFLSLWLAGVLPFI